MYIYIYIERERVTNMTQRKRGRIKKKDVEQRGKYRRENGRKERKIKRK